ncbi:hypothetical protein B0T10DRAFT_493289 [Thelonectria olida]|uniref:Uncharacterized protein n=1 Tax=Thelonectria olida TaxID=1576542 RepID=A0A9P8VZ82_9HYPO|nr:hypothetical protein B0T10DRAFT_493289 [Thelonectria olida]
MRSKRDDVVYSSILASVPLGLCGPRQVQISAVIQCPYLFLSLRLPCSPPSNSVPHESCPFLFHPNLSSAQVRRGLSTTTGFVGLSFILSVTASSDLEELISLFSNFINTSLGPKTCLRFCPAASAFSAVIAVIIPLERLTYSQAKKLEENDAAGK